MEPERIINGCLGILAGVVVVNLIYLTAYLIDKYKN